MYLHDGVYYDIVIHASSKYRWLVGQGVKTPPSHGGIMGSIPVRATSSCQVIWQLFHCFNHIVHVSDSPFLIKRYEFSEKTCILDQFVVTC